MVSIKILICQLYIRLKNIEEYEFSGKHPSQIHLMAKLDYFLKV